MPVLNDMALFKNKVDAAIALRASFGTKIYHFGIRAAYKWVECLYLKMYRGT